MAALVLGTAVACIVVLSPFLSPIVWAAILAYSSWPIFRRFRVMFGKARISAALLMTVLLTCAVVVPALWLLAMLGRELVFAYRNLADLTVSGSYRLPAFIERLPWAGPLIQQQLGLYLADPPLLVRQLRVWAQAWSGEITGMAGGAGRIVGDLFVTIVTVFFFLLDGESIVAQFQGVCRRLFDNVLDPYIAVISSVTRSVVYGLMVTAVAQGIVAAIGYAVVGLSAWMLLGALTGVLSVVPVVGTGIVWGAVSVFLLLADHPWKAVILATWGLVLVHPTDNVLRPLLISNATHVPFLPMLFGVLGGLAIWGLLGAVLGPVVLATGLAIWRNWAVPLPSTAS